MDAGSAFEHLVRFSLVWRKSLLLVLLVLAALGGVYVARHFEMDSRSENLISERVPWRQSELQFNRAFPQRNNLTLVVIDGATPERAEQAAVALRSALLKQPGLFPVVRDLQGDPFFAKNGLLYLPLPQVRDTTAQLIAAQPFLGPLAADPSLRGVMDSLSTALIGVEHGQAPLDQLAGAFRQFSSVFENVLAGKPAFMSWQGMISGHDPSRSEKLRLLQVQARLDYSQLEPGAAASAAIRNTARNLQLTPATGVSVRLTGPVPMADEEFASVAERALPIGILMMSAILLTLWFALRSAKIIGAILVTLVSGFLITSAAGLFLFGSFNLISVAFIPLFVGLGVDFQIQYAVRYRAERHLLRDLAPALTRAGNKIGPSLTLASLATALCFFSFTPTDYIGIAELGVIAGTGMVVAFLLTGTMLPAMLAVLEPEGERAEIGFMRLAPADRFLRRRTGFVLGGFSLLLIAGAALLPYLRFDANPLHLRSSRAESVATLLDLMQDPQTSLDKIDVLTPSLAAAQDLAAKLSPLPDVGGVTTLQTFVPADQQEKLTLISDAQSLLDATLNPVETKGPPTRAETLKSLAATEQALQRVAMTANGAAAESAKQLAATLANLQTADAGMLDAAERAIVPSLLTTLDRARMLLTAGPVSLQTLPGELRRDWITADGQAHVEISPKYHDDTFLEQFTDEIESIVPQATGTLVLIEESRHTIVQAFLRAGVLSLIAVIALLALMLRRTRDVVLTLLPLLAIGVLTFATCVVARVHLNFANIVVLPLLLGIGVAFSIYFVMFWRGGGRDFLQSSLTRAVIYSAATTASGFGALRFSSHPGTASMGELLMICLAWTLAITLVVVPALLNRVPAPASAPVPVPAE
jgi:uncharacterized protein